MSEFRAERLRTPVDVLVCRRSRRVLKADRSPVDGEYVVAVASSPYPVRSAPAPSRAATDSRRLATAALLVLPAGLTAWLAFNSGGFYPGPPAYLAVLLSVVLALRIVLAREPLAGIGRAVGLAGGALALFAVVTLASQQWSHAPGRALVEFDRALDYLLVFVLVGSLGYSRARLTWMLRAFAIAIVAICMCAIVTRLLPQVWPTTADLATNRLSFPVTYWNALGVLAAFGVVLCLHFSSGAGEPPAIRALAAAAVPVLATTIYFTFSRGAIAATAIGVVLYALCARPRLLGTTLLATVPATAASLVAAYDANLLARTGAMTPAEIAQGRHVALVVVLCVVVAGLVRGLLAATLDSRLLCYRLPARSRTQITRVAYGTAAAAALIAVLALHATLAHEYQRFVDPGQPGQSSDLRTRLTDPGNNGRIDMWRVAWHQFELAPVLGHGAGTFENTWAQHRPDASFVVDAHSLYLETLDELGIVGAVLLIGAIAAALAAAARRIRGPDRAVAAAAFTVMVMWALHAAIDWDWEMPVVTLPFFALGGLMLSRRAVPSFDEAREPSVGGRRLPHLRLVLAVACLALTALPAYVWLSQRHLDQATTAFAGGDCQTASASAFASTSVLGDRPEPYEIIGYCDIRRGRTAPGIAAFDRAIALDPGNWNFRYDLAVARATAGLDPLPAVRQAAALDPHEPLILAALRTFAHGGRSQWRREGQTIAAAFTTL